MPQDRASCEIMRE